MPRLQIQKNKTRLKYMGTVSFYHSNLCELQLFGRYSYFVVDLFLKI